MHRKEPISARGCHTTRISQKELEEAEKNSPEELHLFLESWLGGELEITIQFHDKLKMYEFGSNNPELGFIMVFNLSVFNDDDDDYDVFEVKSVLQFSRLTKNKMHDETNISLECVNNVSELYFEFCSYCKKETRELLEEYDRIVKEVQSLDFSQVLNSMIELMEKNMESAHEC